MSYRVVLLEPSGLGSLSIVIALAGQAAAHSLHAMHLYSFALLPFFPSGVSPKSMLSSELGRKRTFFIRIVDGPFWLKRIKKSTEEHGVVKFRTDPLNSRMTTLL